MIVSSCIEDITVTVDSDGDQGTGYAPAVMDDMLTRASREVLRLWLATRQAALEDAEEADE